jgi:hypothetical protein
MAGDTNGSVKALIRTGRRGLYRALLMAIAFLAGVILANRNDLAGTISGSTTEGRAMEAVRQETLGDKTIPPIDGAAPARTETATFALG